MLAYVDRGNPFLCGIGIIIMILICNALKLNGSLALGGVLAGLGILTKTELLLIILGGLFVIETLSVIIQVTSFKTTGKRVFLMSPIHHHFELKGWSETRVVKTFWFAEFVFCILALLTLHYS